MEQFFLSPLKKTRRTAKELEKTQFMFLAEYPFKRHP